MVHADCVEWLKQHERASVHAVVTDPPYGLVEYSSKEQEKLRNGTGGVWRIPPSFDGAERSPVPRFTVLSPSDVRALAEFFFRWARLLAPVLVPGANVVVLRTRCSRMWSPEHSPRRGSSEEGRSFGS